MAAVATAPETFQARAERALITREASLCDILRERGYLLYDERVEYLTGVVTDSAPESLQEAKAIAERASGEFVQRFARSVKGHQLVGATFHQLAEKLRNGTPLPAKSDTDEVKLCLRDITSSDAWRSTLERLDASHPESAPAATKTTIDRKRGRPEAESCDGERIRLFREDNGYSQEHFIMRCKISVDTLQRAESGHATRAVLVKIARRMSHLSQRQVTPDDLKKVTAQNRKN